MTIHPPHEATGVPGLKIEKTGVFIIFLLILLDQSQHHCRENSLLQPTYWQN